MRRVCVSPNLMTESVCLVNLPLPVLIRVSIFFFFNDTATTEIYTLSLHDALPIYANGNIIAQAYPGVYQLSTIMQPPPPPYYQDEVLVGEANLITDEVEIATDVAITVVYKTDGGVVRGTAENCSSGGVVLVPRDPSRRRGFSRSGPCDSSDRYEVRAVRPGEYYAVAFAGNGPVLAAGEASSADLRAITHPVY